MTNRTARLFEIVVAAVNDLGGAVRQIDTEDVAIRCHKLAPAAFSWRKYPDQVNLEMVRVSLSDAKKVKNGALLSGSGRSGWRLTKKGLDWVSSASVPLSKPKSITRRTAGSIDTVRLAREKARVEASRAWTSWKRGEGVPFDEAKALFRIDSYTSDELIDIKITRLSSAFEAGSELRKFLDEASRSIRNGGPNS